MLSAKEVVKFDAEAARQNVILNGPITKDGGNFTDVKWSTVSCLKSILDAEMKKTRSASRKRDLREFGEQRGTREVKLSSRRHSLPKISSINPFGSNVKSPKLGKALEFLSKAKQDAIAELISV